MHIPDGMTEEEVLSIIDAVVRSVAPSFAFAYYDTLDIEQEGRMEALKALPSYTRDRKASLYTFLRVVVRSRLLNLQRNKVGNIKQACYSCSSLANCPHTEDTTDCPRMQQNIKNSTAKRNIMEPCDIDSVHMSMSRGRGRGKSSSSDATQTTTIYGYENDEIDEITKKEISELVDKHMPLSLRSDYLRWRDGNRLPQRRNDVLLEAMRGIVDRYYYKIKIEAEEVNEPHGI
jgi:hypothetical protein